MGPKTLRLGVECGGALRRGRRLQPPGLQPRPLPRGLRGDWPQGDVRRFYSWEDGAWSDPTYAQQIDDCVWSVPSALVGNALYFLFSKTDRVLKYDVTTREITVNHLPPKTHPRHIVLLTTEDGGLGFAEAVESRLYLWSRVPGPDEDDGWVQSRVIELETLLPNGALSTSPSVVGFADGVRLIFVTMNDSLLSVDLKSSQVKKVCGRSGNCEIVVPCMSFSFPALEAASTVEAPRVGASSA